MTQNIFFIGPASVGKSTVAKLLAEELGYNFVDVDLAFCERIALIPDYIDTNGYVAYCQRNSELVDQLLLEYPTKTVFATPSGFLVHEQSPDLVAKHSMLVNENALSVLLLPSKDPHQTAELIAQRQKVRWPEINKQTEIERYIARHKKYKSYGKLKIVGLYSPKQTVDLIMDQSAP